MAENLIKCQCKVYSHYSQNLNKIKLTLMTVFQISPSQRFFRLIAVIKFSLV